MRKQYRLLKDVHWAKAGTIIEEKSDDGTQDFKVIFVFEHPALKNAGYVPGDEILVQRLVVEQMPEFFEEVVPLFVPANKKAKVEKFIASL